MPNTAKVRKKIVLVGPAYPLRGGIANFNEALAIALQKEGHEVIIYSFYYQYPSILFPGKSQYATDEPVPQGLEIKNTISSINPLSWNTSAKQIAAEQPDFVLFRFWLPFMGPALGTIAKKLRKKRIQTIGITDNVIPHEKRIGDTPLTRFFLRNCDGFVTLSKSVLEDIAQFTANPNKISLPHPLYDTFGPATTKEIAAKALDLSLETKYLLFFGLIREYKGLDLALHAMAQDNVRRLGVKLIVAGEFYDKKEKYDALIHELGLQESIIVHDFYIPTEKVKYYFAISDAVLQPYKTATQSGITQVAYHFNQPMIVTNVGGLPEIVPHGKVGLVSDTSAEALAVAIEELYSGTNLVDFQRNILEEKKRFEWVYFVNELISFSESFKSYIPE